MDVSDKVLDYLKKKWECHIFIANRKMHRIHDEYAEAMNIARNITVKRFKNKWSAAIIDAVLSEPDGDEIGCYQFWLAVLEPLKDEINKKYDVEIEHDGGDVMVSFYDQYFTYRGYPDDLEIELQWDLYEMVKIMELVFTEMSINPLSNATAINSPDGCITSGHQGSDEPQTDKSASADRIPVNGNEVNTQGGE